MSEYVAAEDVRMEGAVEMKLQETASEKAKVARERRDCERGTQVVAR